MNSNDIIHLAYAEDHVSVREGIVGVLQELGGVSVDIQADNGIQMLNELIGASRLPDICIIDINMPEMDGFNLVIEIKKRWPLMRILVFTKYGTVTHIVKMIKNGVNGYLTKECKAEEIKIALVAIHQTGYYYSKIADKEMFNAVYSNDVKPFPLSDSETELLIHLVFGLSNKEIAEKMKKTIKGVKSAQERLCKKLNVKKRAGLIHFAIKHGIVSDNF